MLSIVFLYMSPQIAFALDFAETKAQETQIFVIPKSGKIIELMLLTAVAATLVLTAKNGLYNTLKIPLE